MKKIVVGFLSVVLVFLLIGSFAQAGLRFYLDAGYYDPDYGEINEYLSMLSAGTGMGLGLDSGFFSALGIAGGITPKLEVRLEYGDFTSKTSGSFTDSYEWEGVTYTSKYRTKMELTVNPLILSLIYRFSERALSPYVGVGLGSFSAKLSGESWYEEYEDGTLADFSYGQGSYSDDPTGFLVLAGLAKDIGKNFVLRGEVRYIFSTKATFVDRTASPPWSVDCDLGGFMGSVVLEYSF